VGKKSPLQNSTATDEQPNHPSHSLVPRREHKMNDATETTAQHADAAAWADVRARYENGTEPIKTIAESVGLTQVGLTMKAKAMGWLLRNRLKAPAAKGKKETTQALLKRLKDVLHNRLGNLESEIAALGDDVNKLSRESDIRNINTLVRTLEKVLDLEWKNRTSRTKRGTNTKPFDDAERAELAAKLARLGSEEQAPARLQDIANP
jgi:hypothetical protein